MLIQNCGDVTWGFDGWKGGGTCVVLAVSGSVPSSITSIRGRSQAGPSTVAAPGKRIEKP